MSITVGQQINLEFWMIVQVHNMSADVFILHEFWSENVKNRVTIIMRSRRYSNDIVDKAQKIIKISKLLTTEVLITHNLRAHITICCCAKVCNHLFITNSTWLVVDSWVWCLEFIHITTRWWCCWTPMAEACNVTCPQRSAHIWEIPLSSLLKYIHYTYNIFPCFLDG